MSDIENISNPAEEQVTSFKSSIRPIIGTCLAVSALAGMALTTQSPLNPSRPVAATTQLEVVKQGKQPIKAGCANIYGSDPDQVFIDPDTGLRVLTAVFTICDDRSLNGVALSALFSSLTLASSPPRYSTWAAHVMPAVLRAAGPSCHRLALPSLLTMLASGTPTRRCCRTRP